MTQDEDIMAKIKQNHLSNFKQKMRPISEYKDKLFWYSRPWRCERRVYQTSEDRAFRGEIPGFNKEIIVKFLHQRFGQTRYHLNAIVLIHDENYELRFYEYDGRALWVPVNKIYCRSYSEAFRFLNQWRQRFCTEDNFIVPHRSREKQLFNMQRQFSGQWPQYVHERRMKTDSKYREKWNRRQRFS